MSEREEGRTAKGGCGTPLVFRGGLSNFSLVALAVLLLAGCNEPGPRGGDWPTPPPPAYGDDADRAPERAREQARYDSALARLSAIAPAFEARIAGTSTAGKARVVDLRLPGRGGKSSSVAVQVWLLPSEKDEPLAPADAPSNMIYAGTGLYEHWVVSRQPDVVAESRVVAALREKVPLHTETAPAAPPEAVGSATEAHHAIPDQEPPPVGRTATPEGE
jgi:hypothetical protein